MHDDVVPIFQPGSEDEGCYRTMQSCKGTVRDIMQHALTHVRVFDADQDASLAVKLLRTGPSATHQTLHSDFSPGSLKRGRPQRSAMLVLRDNTYLMLADGTAVVAHRCVGREAPLPRQVATLH